MLLKSTNSDKTINMKKEEFRKNSLISLKNISYSKRMKASKIVCDRLEDIIKSVKSKTVLLYLPLESEINVYGLIKALKRDIKIYVPFMECVSFKLVKYRLPLQRKKFNITEPQNSFARVSKIDVAVVPVIGVDGDLRRIGFGKGMYDRFFAKLNPKPLTIFVQLVKRFTKEKLCEAYDVQADFYITPTDIMIRRGKNVFRVRNRGSGRSNSGGCRVCHIKKTRRGEL